MKSHTRVVLAGTAIATVCFVGVLWAWNTLAALFGAPEAEARHVLAVLILAIVLRVLLGRRHGRRRQVHARSPGPV